MRQRSRRLTGQFEAQRPQGGLVTVYVYTTFETVVTTEGSEEVEGLKDLVTQNGHKVNFLGEGKFQVVQTGEILVRA